MAGALGYHPFVLLGNMALLGVPLVYQVLALCTLLVWPTLMFSYLHDRMHIEDFWMTKVPLLKSWFLESAKDARHPSPQREQRRLHGQNFGIGFYFFDRFFPDHGEAPSSLQLDGIIRRPSSAMDWTRRSWCRCAAAARRCSIRTRENSGNRSKT